MGASKFSFSRSQPIEIVLTEDDIHRYGTETTSTSDTNNHDKRQEQQKKNNYNRDCFDGSHATTFECLNDEKKQRPQQGQRQQNVYGYEDVMTGSSLPSRRSSDRAIPRRSSMKKNDSESTYRRRASISYRGEITLVLPTGERTKKRTSISFADEETELNQIREIKPVSTMVGVDPNRLWFQQEEYNFIKREIVRILKQSVKENKGEGPGVERGGWKICTRGLEPIMYGNSTKEARQEANRSVIEEYLMQKRRGEYNDDAIRQIYSFYTIDSKVDAEHKADLDQKEIQNYLKDTRNMWRRRSC